MAEKEKALRFLIYVPKGKEKEFRFYKQLLKEMGIKSINHRVWMMIQNDIEICLSVCETIKEKETKKNE